MSKYLGLDCSTLNLTAVVIDTASDSVIHRNRIIFEQDLPEYQQRHGLLNNSNPLVRHSDPCLWAAALDAIFARMAAAGLNLAEIDGISGSANQHGTVYLNEHFLDGGFLETSAALNTELADVVRPLLSRETSPTWLDLSTFDECREINAAIGGASEVQRRTGSPATERFAGPQIRKFAKEKPEEYANTAVIHLTSSFLCSLLIGKSADIDMADASGMNLEDINRRCWDNELLAATDPRLAGKLPKLCDTSTVAGTIAEYFCRRYGFRGGTPIVTWSGDNMNSLIGSGAWKPGIGVVSLSDNDSYFTAMKKPIFDASGYGHVFLSATGGYQALIDFQNGGLARLLIRDRYSMDWDDFDNRAFAVTPPGNNGNIMLPYFTPESTPLVLNAGPILEGNQLFTSWQDGVGMVRALVEAQAMSMKLHSDWTGSRPSIIRLTGGASPSQGISQVYADVFDARVERLPYSESGALGAAIRAANALDGDSFSSLTRAFCKCDDELTVKPIAENVKAYRKLLTKYQELEQSISG